MTTVDALDTWDRWESTKLIWDSLKNPGSFSRLLEERALDFIQNWNTENPFVKRVMTLYVDTAREADTVWPLSIGGLYKYFQDWGNLDSMRKYLQSDNINSYSYYPTDGILLARLVQYVSVEFAEYLLEDVLNLQKYDQSAIGDLAHTYLQNEDEYLTQVRALKEDNVDLEQQIDLERMINPNNPDILKWMEQKITNTDKINELDRIAWPRFASVKAIEVLLSRITDKEILEKLSRTFPYDPNVFSLPWVHLLNKRLSELKINGLMKSNRSNVSSIL